MYRDEGSATEVVDGVFVCAPSDNYVEFVGADLSEDSRQAFCLYRSIADGGEIRVAARPQSEPEYRVCGFGVGGIRDKETAAFGVWSERRCRNDDARRCAFTYIGASEPCPSDASKFTGACAAEQQRGCAPALYSCYDGAAPTKGQCSADKAYFDARRTCNRYCLAA